MNCCTGGKQYIFGILGVVLWLVLLMLQAFTVESKVVISCDDYEINIDTSGLVPGETFKEDILGCNGENWKIQVTINLARRLLNVVKWLGLSVFGIVSVLHCVSPTKLSMLVISLLCGICLITEIMYTYYCFVVDLKVYPTKCSPPNSLVKVTAPMICLVAVRFIGLLVFYLVSIFKCG